MIIQAQVRIFRDSGLPEDVTVNTFHFDSANDTPDAADFDSLSDRLGTFYVTTATGETVPIRQFLPANLNQQGVEVRFYNAEQLDVGGPLAVRNWNVDWTGSGICPEESAVALSYKAAPVVNVPPPRLRGRIFLGPIASDVLEVSEGRIRVKASYRAAATASMKQHLLDSAGYPLVVYSRGKGTIGRGSTTETATEDWTPFSAEVNQCWMDDAPDTIRSRGSKPTARTIRTAA